MTQKYKLRHLLIATTNEGKVREIKACLGDLPFTIVSLSRFESITQVEETGSTFAENALLKAKGYAKQTGLLTLADDSGLEVDVLKGKPGVYSARFGTSDEQRNKKLLNELIGVPLEKRTARFRCVMALHDPELDRTLIGEGKVDGLITLESTGDNGFGYDPVFYYPPFKATFAQINKTQKNSISHRGQALEKIKEILTKQIVREHR